MIRRRGNVAALAGGLPASASRGERPSASMGKSEAYMTGQP